MYILFIIKLSCYLIISSFKRIPAFLSHHFPIVIFIVITLLSKVGGLPIANRLCALQVPGKAINPEGFHSG